MKLHAVGQGTENVDTYWCFISVPMIELIAEAAPGYTHISTKKKERMKNTYDGICRWQTLLCKFTTSKVKKTR